MRATADIDDVFADWKVHAVLGAWHFTRMHEAPPYSGGVLDAWPAVMVDGLATCRSEEDAVDSFVKWKETARG